MRALWVGRREERRGVRSVIVVRPGVGICGCGGSEDQVKWLRN